MSYEFFSTKFANFVFLIYCIMEILNSLSSRKGNRTEDSNKIVAEQCAADPRLLADISIGLEESDKKLQADCAEVFTMVAEKRPELVAPYAAAILPLLSSKETKTRWEAAHALAYIAEFVPDVVSDALPALRSLIERDKSTIVRDYALDTVAGYAKAGVETSREAYSILKSALAEWGEKHARQVFRGFNNILDHLPGTAVEIRSLTKPYLSAQKKIVAAEAAKIVKRTEK